MNFKKKRILFCINHEYINRFGLSKNTEIIGRNIKFCHRLRKLFQGCAALSHYEKI